MSVYEKMTALANAIREKTGGTDLLTLDGMAEAVNGLEIGGGAKIATGTFIPSEDLGSSCDITITHNLGEIPKLAIVVREPKVKLTEDIKTENEVCFSIAIHKETKAAGYYFKDSTYSSTVRMACGASNFPIYLSSSDTSYLTGSCIYSCTETTAKIYPIKNGDETFIAGNTYRWILMTEEAYNALS